MKPYAWIILIHSSCYITIIQAAYVIMFMVIFIHTISWCVHLHCASFTSFIVYYSIPLLWSLLPPIAIEVSKVYYLMHTFKNFYHRSRPGSLCIWHPQVQVVCLYITISLLKLHLHLDNELACCLCLNIQFFYCDLTQTFNAKSYFQHEMVSEQKLSMYGTPQNNFQGISDLLFA